MEPCPSTINHRKALTTLILVLVLGLAAGATLRPSSPSVSFLTGIPL